MNHQTGKLILISGPSGTGKSTVIARLMRLRDDVCFSVSATTRDPRPGEVDGKDYFFVTRTAFDAMVAADELLEAFNQSSILIQANPTRTEFYSGK